MSGQVCFDFMLNEADNVLYCIECESSLTVPLAAYCAWDYFRGCLSPRCSYSCEVCTVARSVSASLLTSLLGFCRQSSDQH